MNIKVGFGNDIHKLTESRRLYIGGVYIPYEKGAEAHSDGDVLIHSICDALLGALALKDIGNHFPDNDPKYKDIDSKQLLSKVIDIINKNGYVINNLDSSVVLQKPKLAPYIDTIRETLAAIMNVNKDIISVKAKTNEGLGDIGQCNAIAAYCIVSLKKQ